MAPGPDRWATVERLYHEALSRPVEGRAAFLAEACADDALRAEVESLLAQGGSRDDALTRGAVVAAAGLISDVGTTTLTGRRIGVYQILAPIGAGGMGEVYRARDTRLGREVAIKFLPRAFTTDTNRLARFEREARVLASLNHPHIGGIHGIEDAPIDGGPPVRALILELVEGETLAERIAHTESKALPVKEALEIARQIADALDAAHEKGIVHRDLKPANIKITPDGVVKVLDFGLATVVAGDGSTPDFTQSPTMTIGSTRDGVILGTAAYMSPEQARGVPVDKRTDIWAFGCVLYEMLTGRVTFVGDTVSDTIAAILEREPDWTVLPPETPAGVQRVLHRCLTKDPKRRLRDIGDVRNEIEDFPHLPPSSISTAALRDSRRLWYWSVAAAAVLLSVVAIVAEWNPKLSPETVPSSGARLTMPLPDGIRLSTAGFGSNLVVSPDGQYVAFVGEQGATSRLYLRTLQDREARVIPGSEGASGPFFSPDSQWVALFAAGKLMKAPTRGGAPTVLGDAPAPRGGFWGDNGTIVFSPTARGSGIFQISVNGGTANAITMLDTAGGETSHRSPELLPGGDTLLYAAYGATYQDVSVVAQSLRSGRRNTLLRGAGLPHYISSTGHLLYTQPKKPGTIMAIAFDPANASVIGTPAAVIDDVLTYRGDTAHLSAARTGTLVYAPGGFREPEGDLVYVDRKGVGTPVGTPLARPYGYPRISPDGRRIVVAINGVQNSLWIYEESSRSFSRFSFGGNAGWPVWTPDGKRITYAVNRAEPWRLFWKPSDGSEEEEILLHAERGDQEPYGWSSDGKVLLYQDITAATGQDVWALSLDGDRGPRPVLQTRVAEVDARLSHNDRWLAYASNESGRFEVYVQPFAGSGGKWQISSEGGREPVWAHNDREIFYRSGDRMMVVPVVTEPSFQVSGSQSLFQGPYQIATTVSPSYDVTPDDQRFLMIRPSASQSSVSDLNVVLNWTEELKRLVPTK
jgi:serine/threonine-protein kinase